MELKPCLCLQVLPDTTDQPESWRRLTSLLTSIPNKSMDKVQKGMFLVDLKKGREI